MNARQTPAVEPAPVLGWARRLLRQQLEVLSRLADAARRRIEPAPSLAGPITFETLSAGLVGLERALRLQVRRVWAEGLIAVLRARLVADLRTLDEGRLPNPLSPAPSLAAAPGRRPEKDAEKAERSERRERETYRFRRGFSKILRLPTVEIIALICRRLGLPPDWPHLAQDGWAREHRSPDDGGGGSDRSSPPWPGTGFDRLSRKAQTAIGLILQAGGHPPKPVFSSS